MSHDRRTNEADHFQVVWSDGKLSAMQAFLSLDNQCIRADVLHTCAHCIQQFT